VNRTYLKKVAYAASHLILADLEVLGKRKFVHTKVTAIRLPGPAGDRGMNLGGRARSSFLPSEKRNI
jgi:hypothetical protein